jgi:hypothetical protein
MACVSNHGDHGAVGQRAQEKERTTSPEPASGSPAATSLRVCHAPVRMQRSVLRRERDQNREASPRAARPRLSYRPGFPFDLLRSRACPHIRVQARLTTESAIQQRVVRAKRTLSEAHV